MPKTYYKHTWPEGIEKKILKLFYRTKLRWNEVIIDNRDKTIADELGVHISVVQGVLEREVINYYKRLNKKLS